MRNHSFLITTTSIFLLVVGMGSVFAEQHPHIVNSPNICGDQICALNHLGFDITKPKFQHIPQQDTGNGANPNWYICIHLPTYGNNGCGWSFILNNTDFIQLKNNVAVMNVEYHTTTSIPNADYCKEAKFILENQGTPEYLNRIYNITKNVDLTDFVYPVSCYSDTGPNPINGHGLFSVPEFPFGGVFIILISLGFILLLRNKCPSHV